MTRLAKTSIVLFLALFWTTLLINLSFADESEIASGTWTTKGYAINGGWKIVARDDKKIIIFDEHFKTKKGPDLKVYLSRKSIKDIGGGDVIQSSVKIGRLNSHKGAQEYEIPNNVNLNDFASLLIHCEAYAHLWGGAALRWNLENN